MFLKNRNTECAGFISRSLLLFIRDMSNNTKNRHVRVVAGHLHLGIAMIAIYWSPRNYPIYVSLHTIWHTDGLVNVLMYLNIDREHMHLELTLQMKSDVLNCRTELCYIDAKYSTSTANTISFEHGVIF
jgi:hypothetical protein